jgi:hypothetical protein
VRPCIGLTSYLICRGALVGSVELWAASVEFWMASYSFN